jgi:hypothetical protein
VRLCPLACCAATCLAATAASAQPRGPASETRAVEREPYRDAPGVTPIGEPVRATADTPDQRIRLAGFLRARADLGHNWDLGRGPTPSLPSIWPTPYVDDGASHTQTNADMRLRVDATIEVGWGVSLHARAHVLDNLRLGSLPTGDLVGGSVTQRGPDQPIDVRQVYGQVLLPFGVLTAGRMGALVDWGTGFYLNAGNGLDDDYGDVGDRIAFTTPLAGLLWTALYEISATGPSTEAVRPDIRPAFDLDPRDDVHTVAFSVARWNSPATRNRRLRASRHTFEFGLVGSYRWQSYDVTAGDVPSARTALVRDLTAFVGDAWARADLGRVSFEGEFYRGGERFVARVEFGFASGDDRPGFGARPVATSGRAGDLDGLQFDLTRTPRDVNVQNFRFSPNYRVDLIMWRRLIGTVTDAWYVRPMVRYRLGSMLTAEAAVIASVAMEPNSTPSGTAPLGVETDLGLVYEQEHGFVMRLDYGLLLPLSGFDNVARRASASPAHALHAVMAWRF